MSRRSILHVPFYKKSFFGCNVILFAAFFVSSAASLSAQNINWPDFVGKHDLTWTSIDNNFFHGAFIGDGVQGAMIIQDDVNPNAIRMLMGHYKAITYYQISGYEFCTSRVYAGNIVITPAGTPSSRTMRMNLWDGEAGGTLTTDKGSITWIALADRKNLVFVVVTKSQGGETASTLGVREEWGITPKFYLENVNPSTYASQLPPKPVLSSQGNINLVINKMKTRGAHVVASQLVSEGDSIKILYVAIGTDGNTDLTVAAQNATTDAVSRVQAAVQEGRSAIIARNRAWWHEYHQTSYLEIKEDPAWEKFWWLQVYKFACASSQASDLIIDTQGPWIWKTAWAAIWWNLNAQLSYYPMYSANKLDAGRSLVNGMDRIFKSGVFGKNANGVGITIGRGSTWEGIDNWGDEWGNMPWMLQSYWKYWKYSGIDSLARPLFAMLRESATFLMSKLEKGTDGKYHLLPSRSPEYTEDLHRDANYSLMSIRWVLQTLLDMDRELGANDAQRGLWQGRLDSLVDYPVDANGLRVNIDQGFNTGHRHYSHLIGIYPYHVLNPEQGTAAKDLIATSLNRWQALTQASGYAGYTFTGGCSMYATLGNGDKAISTLDLLKSHNLIQVNTMYNEGGGPVVETPLSAVESIGYLLLQSWGNKIRIFPAVPSRWKNVTMKNFRTEGAFLVSASLGNGVISGVTLHSDKGKVCTIVNPWPEKPLTVRDNSGTRVTVTVNGTVCTFSTQAGKTYYLNDSNIAINREIHAAPAGRRSAVFCRTGRGTIHVATGFQAPIKKIRLISIQGRIVKEMDVAGKGETAIDISNIPAGVYTVVMEMENQRETGNFIKIRP